MKKTEMLVAKGIMSYNRRVMQAGEIFLASAVDADYLIRRGQAQRAPPQAPPMPTAAIAAAVVQERTELHVTTIDSPVVETVGLSVVESGYDKPEMKAEQFVYSVDKLINADPPAGSDAAAAEEEHGAEAQTDIATDPATEDATEDDDTPDDEAAPGQDVDPQRASPARVSHNTRRRSNRGR